LNLDGTVYNEVIAPVTITADVNDGEFLVIRWYQDRTNSAGDATTIYHALAIDDVSISVVPEPSIIALNIGLLALGVVLLRRRGRK
jgi:hypothetical protein